MSKGVASDKSEHCRQCPAWSRSVFRSLSPRLLDQLSERKAVRLHQRGENFNEQGRPTDRIYCLRDGNAKVTHSGERGRESIVRIASAGDLLGYRCIFSEERFRATASALEPTTACTIDAAFLIEVVHMEPPFALELLARMGQEIATSENRHHSFCQKDTRERIAEALLLLKERCGKRQGDGWLLDIKLTRLELASWVGTAKETVIRCLSSFKDDGLIRQDEDSLILVDIEKIREIARIK